MIFAKRAYQAAGVWGLTVVILGYISFLTGTEPAMQNASHPVFIHGFFLVCLPWQLAFFVIATDPTRYRPLIPITWIEKFPFAAVIFWLFSIGAVDAVTLVMGIADAILGVVFLVSYRLTRSA